MEDILDAHHALLEDTATGEGMPEAPTFNVVEIVDGVQLPLGEQYTFVPNNNDLTTHVEHNVKSLDSPDQPLVEACVKTFTLDPVTEEVSIGANAEVNAKLNALANNIAEASKQDPMTVDIKALLKQWLDATDWQGSDLIVPLSEVAVACGCDDCVEAESDDDFNMLHDMYTQLEAKFGALEARIAAYNVRASHKI